MTKLRQIAQAKTLNMHGGGGEFSFLEKLGEESNVLVSVRVRHADGHVSREILPFLSHCHVQLLCHRVTRLQPLEAGNLDNLRVEVHTEQQRVQNEVFCLRDTDEARFSMRRKADLYGR